MTQNSKTPRGLSGASQKNLAAGGGGGLDAIVSHPLPTAHQAELFHVDEATAEYPIARPLPLATRGRTEYGVRCPKCDQMHRHVFLGLVRAPCGARYYVQPKRGRTRRAA